jgi:hypothetical protein
MSETPHSTMGRRALVAGAVALPVAAAVAPAVASPITGLSAPIAAALVPVKERRAIMDALIEEEDRLELVYCGDEAKALPEHEREELAVRIGLRRLQRRIRVGWHRWGRAVNQLARVPAVTVADVEATFRAIADCRGPGEVYAIGFADRHLASIWRDLIRLSAGGAA